MGQLLEEIIESARRGLPELHTRILADEVVRLRDDLATAREVIQESMEARRVTEAEGGPLNQANNDIDRLRARVAELEAAQAPDVAPVPREAVRAFAGAMEATLRKNDHKGGWENETWRFLWGKLREEFVEVTTEMMPLLDEQFMGLPTGLPDFAKLASESVDLANMAMMLYDNAQRALRSGEATKGARG